MIMKKVLRQLGCVILFLFTRLNLSAQFIYFFDNGSNTLHWKKIDDNTGTGNVSSNGTAITILGQNDPVHGNFETGMMFQADTSITFVTVHDLLPLNISQGGKISLHIVNQPAFGQLSIRLGLYRVIDAACDISTMPVSASQADVLYDSTLVAGAGNNITFTLDLSNPTMANQVIAAHDYAVIQNGGNPVPFPDAFQIRVAWASFTGGPSAISINNIEYNAPPGTVTNPSTCFTFNVLPITLSSFTAMEKGEKVQLNWTTASEQNNDFFEIQRSLTGIDFSKIGKVKGSGTSNTTQNYTFIDLSPATGTNLYRLRQLDLDGKSSYSGIRTVKFDNTQKTIFLHFPTENGMQSALLSINDFSAHIPISARLIALTGQVVWKGEFTIRSSITIPGNFAHGVYAIILSQPGITVSKKLAL
ncbi:hypothetical protein ACX0G9_23185 [Flavitalea flava]